jgi:hypothetical protein
MLFITILLFGLVAVWAKGDLDWVLSYDGPKFVPTRGRARTPIPSVEELSEQAIPTEGEETVGGGGTDEGEAA